MKFKIDTVKEYIALHRLRKCDFRKRGNVTQVQIKFKAKYVVSYYWPYAEKPTIELDSWAKLHRKKLRNLLDTHGIQYASYHENLFSFIVLLAHDHDVALLKLLQTDDTE